MAQTGWLQWKQDNNLCQTLMIAEVHYAVVKQQCEPLNLALAAKLINRDTPSGKGVGKNKLAGLRDGIVVRAKEANLKGSFHLLTFICE